MGGKVVQHILYIAMAMERIGLWDDEDGLFYDQLRLPDGHAERLRVRSLVSLLPLAATVLMTPQALQRLPGIGESIRQEAVDHPELYNIGLFEQPGQDGIRLVGALNEDKVRRILARMLDESELLGPPGIRANPRYHQDHPYLGEG